MKVVVLGGYGVFGARLVRLLIRDGHDVVVAGRSEAKANAFAQEVSAQSLTVDRQGNLAPLWALSPDAVVDAAGPFHAYVDAPYRLAQACIAQAVHYLDLADDAAFCAGISALDEDAKAAGVFILSGVSSVPAISSAAVTALAQGAGEIDTISSAILPGNRAPRGRSVVESILNQCGMPMEVCMDGVTLPVRSWSRPDVFDLGQGMHRPAWMIEVPDHLLFVQAFGARSVLFRAGMELGVMNWGLAAYGWLRAKLRFGTPAWFVSLLLWFAKRLEPFGTDEGGMSVIVTARFPEGWRRRTWRMIAREGEGPFVPAVAARALLRTPQDIIVGARPAVAVVSLAAVESAMFDLAIETEIVEDKIVPLFQQFLGSDFGLLPPAVQAGHAVYGPRRWAGRARVSRGTSLWSRLLARLFGFPPASEDTSVTVAMTPQKGGELWERRFDGKPFWSFLKVQEDRMTEQFGPLTFTLGLHVTDGELHYPVLAGRIGPVPLPKLLLPQSIAKEFEREGRFHFDVQLRAPFTGAPMVHYQGWLVPEALGIGDGDQQVIERPKTLAIP